MSPRAVATWSAAAMAMVVLTNHPVYRLLIALVAINVLVARRRPGTSLRALLSVLATFALITVAYNPLINHAGSHPIATIPTSLPGIGGPITVESIAYGVSAAIGVVAAALAVAPLVMVIDPTDLLQALPSRLHGTATALAASLNLVPAVARSFRRVREAELLRGVSRRGPGALLAIVVPVTLTTIESSITLAEAMESRAYGSGPRTRYRVPLLARSDGVVMSAALAAVAALLLARLAGVGLDWYPFPDLVLPGTNPAVVAACLLLAAPVRVRR